MPRRACILVLALSLIPSADTGLAEEAESRAAPQEITLPAKVVVGQRFAIRIVEERELAAEGEAPHAERLVTDIDAEVVAGHEGGWLYRWVYRHPRLPDFGCAKFSTGWLTLPSKLKSDSKGLTIEFTTDGAGRPVAIVNLPEVRRAVAVLVGALRDAANASVEPSDLDSFVRDLCLQRTMAFLYLPPEDEIVDHLLRDAILLYRFGGETFRLGNVLKRADWIVNPLDASRGDAVPAISEIVMTNLDSEMDRAVVELIRKPERDALKEWLVERSKRMEPFDRALEEAGVARRPSIEGLDVYDRATFTISTSSGRTEAVVYQRTTLVRMGTREGTQIDRRIITSRPLP